MENWVIFLLGLVFGIPLSIFANLATPWVKSFFENRSLSAREREIEEVLYEYRYIRGARDEPERLIFSLFRGLAMMIGSLTTGAGLLGLFYALSETHLNLDVMLGTVSLIVLFINLFVISFIDKTTKYIVKPDDFDEFREKTIKKLIKLGGNPEDLDEDEEEDDD